MRGSCSKVDGYTIVKPKEGPERKKKKLVDGKIIGRRGRLNDNQIDKISSYYRNAISGKNNPHKRTNNLTEMRKTIWAIYFHKRFSDDNPMHSLEQHIHVMQL